MTEIFKTESDILQFNEWIKALESGDYPQAKLHLQTLDGYCCLGIGCKLFIKNPVVSGNGLIVGGVPEAQKDAPQWLTEINNDFRKIRGHSLSELNDHYNHKFYEIASALRQTYPEYIRS